MSGKVPSFYISISLELHEPDYIFYGIQSYSGLTGQCRTIYHKNIACNSVVVYAIPLNKHE